MVNGHQDPAIVKQMLEQKQREQQLNRVTMLQLITSKLEAVFKGKKYEANLIMAGLAVIAAKIISQGPKEAHGQMFVQFAKTVHDAVAATYPVTTLKGSDGSSAEKPTDVNGVVSAEVPKSTN